MDEYFNSVKQFASSTFNSVSNAVTDSKSTQQPTFMTVNRNQYQVLEKQGEGGFSFVYKVSDESGQVYALKRILLADKKGAEAAKREVQFLKDIPRHRAVVELVASEVSSKEALLLFEYCGGGSVYTLIERRLEQGRPLAEDEVWAVYHAACEAVEHLHSQQPPVIHRDLKHDFFSLLASFPSDFFSCRVRFRVVFCFVPEPLCPQVENLLLAKRGVVLCDFGSATTHVYNTQSAAERRAAEDDINNNTTMTYRSPEMADLFSGKKITEKSDVWALGVLLYRLAYFEPPWEADSSLAILNCKYRIPNNRYSDHLPGLIKALLVLDPAKRPDVYFVLERVLAVRSKTMSATMAQRRDAYRARAQQQQQQPSVQSASHGGGGGGGGGGRGDAVAVDGGGFVAASLFGQLDWQDASGASAQPPPPLRQQQQAAFGAPPPQQQLFAAQFAAPPPQQQQFQQQFQQPSQTPMFPVSFDQFPANQGSGSSARQPSAAVPQSQSNVSPLFEQAFLMAPSQPQPLQQQPSFSPAPQRVQQQPAYSSPAVGRLPSQANSPAMHRLAPESQAAHQRQPSFGSFAGPAQQQPFFADFSQAATVPQQQQQFFQQPAQQHYPTLHAMPNQAPAKSLDDLFK